MKQRSSITGVISPLRPWSHRLLFVLAIIAGLSLTIMERNDAVLLQRARASFLDWVAPLLSALSAPVLTVHQLADGVSDYFRLRDTNLRLKQENALLLQWQQVARDLKYENDNLRQLLHFQPIPGSVFVTVPIIAELNSDYHRTAIILAGAEKRINKGNAVIGDYGLIGRVQEVGKRAARILLLTDISSRMPVMVERSRLGAVLSGTSTGLPELTLLTDIADLQVGDRIVTSGAGGLIPVGLPVGKIASLEGNRIKVELYADLDRLDFVRVVDFNLNDILEHDLGDASPSPRIKKTNSQ